MLADNVADKDASGDQDECCGRERRPAQAPHVARRPSLKGSWPLGCLARVVSPRGQRPLRVGPAGRGTVGLDDLRRSHRCRLFSNNR